MPDVVGQQLDIAMSDLGRAGIDEGDVEVVGGGTFGVIDESNWTVCEQDPSAGSPAEGVRVIVDRVCGGEDSEGAVDTTAPTTESPESTESPDPTATGGSDDLIVVPNMVGGDLQDAQDTMQAAGLYVLSSNDATGQDRFQVLDRNWTVCGQTPAGGSRVTADTEVIFDVVKDEESCP